MLFPIFAPFDVHAGIFAGEAAWLLVATLAVRRQRWVPEDIFLFNAVQPRALAATALVAVGAALIVGEVDTRLHALWEMVGSEPPLSAQRFLLEIQTVTGPGSFGLVLVAAVLMPALAEELFFRGVVFSGLRYHHGPVTAMAGSALLFAAVHFDPWSFPALALLGLCLAALVHWTHSVWPAVLAHAINNGLSVLQVNGTIYAGWDETLPALVLLLAALLAVAGVLLLRRVRPLMPILSPWSRPAPADGPDGVWA